MRELSIPFNTEMVRAILDGRKTMTRRIVKLDLGLADTDKNDINAKDLCRYRVGDVLWVRETWSFVTCGECTGSESHSDFDSTGCCIPVSGKGCLMGECGCFVYRANHGTTETDIFPPSMFRWRPSIHMPKSAARIFLRVTNVRVERLWDITEDDALKEGAKAYGPNSCSGTSARIAFAELWDSIYEGKGYGWGTNPWVWVIEFERVERHE